MNILSDKIQVFPTVNSRDDGKLMLEENVYNIARRITKLNYVYDNFPDINDNVSIVTSQDLQNIGLQFDDGIYCSIHGYDVIVSILTIYFTDESDYTAKSDRIKVKSEEYTTDDDNPVVLPFGLVLSRMAVPEDEHKKRLKGDKLVQENIDETYYYFGVDVLIGDDFDNARNDLKLKLGTIIIHKDQNNKPTFSLDDINLDYNKFIIDGDTVCIIDGDQVYKLEDFISGKYVAKEGNNYGDSPEIKHVSDMYGSLTFRDNEESQDSYIEIGFSNDYSNKLSLAEFDYPLTTTDKIPSGIKIYSVYRDFSHGFNSGISFDNFSIINYPSDSIARNTIDPTWNLDDLNLLEITNSTSIRPDPQNPPVNYYDPSMLGISTNLFEIKVGRIFDGSTNRLTDYNKIYDRRREETVDIETDKYRPYVTVHFDRDKSFLFYDSESVVGTYADYDYSTIFFGNLKNYPMFINYDTENHDLLINDLLGTIGVVRYCDGTCVDENSTYSDINDPYHNDNDFPYNYEDPYVPKEYSETKKIFLSNGDTEFYYIEDSYIHDIFIPVSKYSDLNLNTKTTFYSGNMIDDLLVNKEERCGFYVNSSGIFTPSKGAFDQDVNGNIINPPSNHEYASVWNGELQSTVNTYDYICTRYEINSKLFGKQLLISNIQEFVSKINNDSDIISSDKELFDPNKINIYFCKDRIDGDTGTEIQFGYDKQYPQMDGSTYPAVKKYTLVETRSTNNISNVLGVITFNEFSNGNHRIQIPNPTLEQNQKLYIVISYSSRSLRNINSNYRSYKYGTRVIYDGIISPTNNPSSNYNKHGYIKSGVLINYDPTYLLLTISYIDTSHVYNIDGENVYRLIYNNKLKIDSNKINLIRFSFDTNTNEYITDSENSYYYGYYETSKNYKSFRIHGFFPAHSEYKTQGIDSDFDTQPTDNNLYKYYRLIYNVGFEFSDIIIEKINDLEITGHPDITTLYKLYRADGKDLIITAKSISNNNDTDNNGPRKYTKKYFYISDLKLNSQDKIFMATNDNYNNDDEIFLNINYISDSEKPLYSEFYKTQVIQTSNHYITQDNKVINKWWFIKDLIITNTAGINFNIGKNRLHVNVNSHFNETIYPVKIMFGETDEFSTVMNMQTTRFVYPKEVDGVNKYKPIRIDKDGITFENDPDSLVENSSTISKIYDEETGFDGLNITGDLKADRVFNAVYNDYADNVLCSRVSEYEPGDIICKDPYSDEYVISNYDLRYLAVGVYSDTYGHLLGGDFPNSKNYVPIAVAGNVMVKVKGFVNIGDLIEISNLPGVGQVSKKPEFGTIIGKALQSKNTSEVERILMQVMLI